MAINNLRVQTRYSDFKSGFDIHPTKLDLVRSTNADAVKKSIRNLMLTAPYERMFEPNIGAGLRTYLFENVDQLTTHAIREKIKQTIEQYEPRAEVLQIDINLVAERHDLQITIVFAVINITEPQTVTIILERVR